MATLFYWNSAGILDLGPDPIIFTVSRETPQFKDASPIGANRFLVDDFGDRIFNNAPGACGP